MKKSIIFILILVIIPLMSAVEFDMKSNFSQGETLIAKVSGNFLEPILKENVFFYRDGHVRIPLEYNIGKINEEFYIYALLADKEPYNNYSLVIKNVEYMKGNQISEEEIIKDFSITNNTADFSVNPGFIISNGNFFLEVQNLQENKITIQVKTEETTEQESDNESENNESEEDSGFFDFFGSGNVILNPEEDSFILKSGEIKEILFEVKEIDKSSLKIIELITDDFKYEIPIYIFTEEETEKEIGIKFDPSELNLSLPTNSNATRIIYLYNTGEETIENISLSISDSLKSYFNISTNNIEELEKNSSIRIELFFFSEEENQILGNIRAYTGDESFSTYLTISLNFLEDYVPPEDEIPLTKTCLELGGVKCSAGEECNAESINTKDGTCCLGICEGIEESNLGLIIGIGLLIIVAGIIAWFFIKKYKGAKKKVDLLKIAKGKRPIQKPSQIKKIEQPSSRRKIPPSQLIRRPIQQRPRHIIKYIEKPVIKEIEKVVEKPIIKEKIIEKPVIKEVEKKVFVEKPKRPAPPRYKYKASTESQTYHKTSCRLAKLIKQKYKLTNNSISYFKKKGYKPCKVCLR